MARSRGITVPPRRDVPSRTIEAIPEPMR